MRQHAGLTELSSLNIILLVRVFDHWNVSSNRGRPYKLSQSESGQSRTPIERPVCSQSGGGPRVVVSTAAFHARARLGSRSRQFERNKNVSSPSTCKTQCCGEPPWLRGSVLGLRPPGLEFRILRLEDSVISFISPSSGGSPGPV